MNLRPWLRGSVLPVLLAAVLAAAGWWNLLPSPLFSEPYSSLIVDRSGGLLGATRAPDDQWRFAPGGTLPAKYVTALLAFEDKRYLQHFGFDPAALTRAAWQNAQAGSTQSGGSTLTMQVVRLARKNPDRSLGEKLIELLWAARLELTTSKTGILELWAAHAPFGGNVVGLEAAAWRYFGRSPQALSWAEAALLAVLPNSPAQLHLGRQRDRLLDKRNRLLDRLADLGHFDRQTLELAKAESLPPAPYPLPQRAPQLLALADQTQAGQRLTTTLDPEIQDRASALLARYLNTLSGNGVHNGAVLIQDTRSGQVLAYVGNNPDQRAPGALNDLIQAPRSTGSLLKPFLFASMLDSGDLTPQQLVIDIPTRMGSYIPENNTKTYSGALPAAEALARSLNVPAARELRTYGLDRFYGQLKKIGLTTLFRRAELYGLTLILGGSEGRLWELTSAYAGLARTALSPDGAKTSAFFPARYQQGQPRPAPTDSSPFSPGAAYLTLEAMKDLSRPGDNASWQSFTSSRRVAWKTGTSFGFRDAWAIGTTPEFTVGIWIGNASGEGRPNLLGFAVAAPILFDVFNLLGATTWFKPPLEDLKQVELCRQSGYLPGPNCQDRVTVHLPRGANPAEICPYHKLLHLDPTGQFQVTSATAQVDQIQQRTWFILPPGVEYFYRPTHLEYRPPPPFKAGSQPLDENSPLSLIFPEEGAQIYIPVTLDGTPGQVIFQAAHRNPRSTLFWHLDGTYLGATADFHQWESRPGKGPHTLVLWDEAGHRLERHFQILSQ